MYLITYTDIDTLEEFELADDQAEVDQVINDLEQQGCLNIKVEQVWQDRYTGRSGPGVEHGRARE